MYICFKEFGVSRNLEFQGKESLRSLSRLGGRLWLFWDQGDESGRNLSHEVRAYRGPGNAHNQSSQEKQEHREQESWQAKSSHGS